MKLKEKMKRLWRMDRSRSEGFTLVELIVVIAILAVLAGIAVPAYSGYVEKAEQAAEEQLLSEVNTAFASAYAFNGESHIGRKDVPNQVLEDGVLNYNGPHADTFNDFYEGGEFKIYTALMYNALTGTFTAGSAYAGGYTVSNEDLQKILGSEYANMEADEIIKLVGSGSIVVSGMNSFGPLVASPEFAEAAGQMLGQDYEEFLQNYYKQEILKEMGLPTDTDINGLGLSARIEYESYLSNTTYTDGLKKTIDTNMMVMLSAKEAQNASGTIISTLTTGTNPVQTLKDNLTADPTLGLAQSALAFGLYTAYAGDNASVLDMFTELEDENSGFRNYLQNESSKDMDGLLAAMNVINSQNSEVIQNTAVNGFIDNSGNIVNTDLQQALQQILGQK